MLKNYLAPLIKIKTLSENDVITASVIGDDNVIYWSNGDQEVESAWN